MCQQAVVMGEPVLTSIRAVQLASDRRMAQICFWIFAVTPLWFTIQDATGLVWGAIPFGWVGIRTALHLVPIAGVLAIRRVTNPEKYSQVAFWAGLSVAAIIVANSAMRPEVETVPLRGRIMAPALMYLLLPNSFARQIAAPLLLSASQMVLRLARVESLTLESFASDAVIVVIINLAGILMIRRRLELEGEIQKLWQRESTARDEARRANADLAMLRGIIPICSYCRRVRSEVGDWQQVEQYVSEHSNADFSHGICPQCRSQQFAVFTDTP